MNDERRIKIALALLAREEERMLKAAEQRKLYNRAYMREYMRKRRGTQDQGAFTGSKVDRKLHEERKALEQRERRRAYNKERYLAETLAIRALPGLTAADEEKRRLWRKDYMRDWAAKTR